MKRRLLTGNLLTLFKWQFVDYWYAYILGVIALVLTHFIQSYIPMYAKELAELIGDERVSISLWLLFWMALGIIVFRTSSRLLFFWPARALEKNLRVQLLGFLEETPPIRYQGYSSGQIFQVINNDCEQIRALLGFVLLQVGNIMVALMVIMPRLFSYQRELIVALLPMFITVLVFTWIVHHGKRYFKMAQDDQGDLQNFVIEVYDGKTTIKNYHVEKNFNKLFMQYSHKELMNFYYAGRNVAFSRPLIYLGVGLSLLWGAWIIYEKQMGSSYLILFSGFVFLLMEPLSYVSWIGVVSVRAGASWKRLQELMRLLLRESSQEKRLASLNQDNDSMKTLMVSFWDKQLPITIIESGFTILVGKTGCGKTEVAFQLAQILKTRGVKISFVAQEPYLYNDILLNNIFLGRLVTDELKEKAFFLLKLFCLDYLAASKDELFSLEIGENGKKLSGGQRKRLALVRSLLEEADYYIWDDPFSSVDILTEKKIIAELMKDDQVRHATFILTGHRLSTVTYCKQVIFLDQCEGITEQGMTSLLLQSESKTNAFFKNQLV